MKNLCIVNVHRDKIHLKTREKYLISYNNDENVNGVVYVAYNLFLERHNLSDQLKWSLHLAQYVNETGLPVNITYLTLPNLICVGFSSGEIITTNENGSDCIVAGICDNSIQALEWSPDQELAVLVSNKLNMTLMSCTFDPICEVNLEEEEFGEKEFVTVGWGKKETQFHGSEGKQAAKVKIDWKKDEEEIPYYVKITWRGDGELYAIGFTTACIRRFKIFDREGNLQYTSEKQPGLGETLSWRPSGNVIATTQNLPNKYVVAFFEKNGLKHGEFIIPVNSSNYVKNLVWSSDSEILALHCIEKSDQSLETVLLFTTSNYHWYLKQTLNFDRGQKIASLFWDNDFSVSNNKKLHIFFEDGLYYSYKWIWSINHSVGKSDNDDAVVAVINGRKLLITAFRHSVVPPPIASLEIELDYCIQSVHFAIDKLMDSNSFFVCTDDFKLHFFKQISKVPLKYDLLGYTNVTHEMPFQYYNWIWINEETIISFKLTDSGYYLHEFSVDFQKEMTMKLKHSMALEKSVFQVHVHPLDNSKLFLQMFDGEILEYILGERIIPHIKLPQPTPSFGIVFVEDETYIIALTQTGHLYINETEVLNNVSSFFIHTHFLLVTTLRHYLLCIELTKPGLSGTFQKLTSDYVYTRKIERGAKIIIAVPNDTRTVLQMPRGNLETVQPRPLSLKIIGKYLDCLKYKDAFDIMRKQRINLNLIYDHNPEMFVNNIGNFIECIANNSWLSLFLSELENIDVTQTMYSNCYNGNMTKASSKNKINTVCDIVRAHLAKSPDRQYKVLPILTSYVKKNTIVDLENALNIIKELKNKEINGEKLPVGSEEALKYLLYMVDVNNLFDVALGMYDFDLVLLVATKSQKDPKEYIPMLNEWNDMEENYKRFCINKYLKRFSRAVECLAKCGPNKYDELRNFIKYHSLYCESLDLFTIADRIYNEISEDYGLYLKLKKQYIGAGIIFRRCGNNDKAIECFKEALEWELAIELAHSWPNQKLKELCRDMVCALKEEKRHTEALKILENYCNDHEETILYAINCGHYRTALQLCSSFKRPELRDNELLTAVLEELSSLKDLINTNSSTFLRHKSRLKLVRETKNTMSTEFDTPYLNKDSDLYSDAGSTVVSNSSRTSSKTFRSSKNRRKHERKLASLKEGSQYEDVALLMVLNTLILSTFDLRMHVREVNIALCCFNKDNEAALLQNSLDSLLNNMKDSFKEIWTDQLVLDATNAVIAAKNVPEGVNIIPQGIATLEPHVRIAPVIQEMNWKLEGLLL